MRTTRILAERTRGAPKDFEPQCLAQGLTKLPTAPPAFGPVNDWYHNVNDGILGPYNPSIPFNLYAKTDQESLLKTFGRSRKWVLEYQFTASWFNFTNGDPTSGVDYDSGLVTTDEFGIAVDLPTVEERMLPHFYGPRIVLPATQIGSFTDGDGLGNFLQGTVYAEISLEFMTGGNFGFGGVMNPTNATFNGIPFDGNNLFNSTIFRGSPVWIDYFDRDYYLFPQFRLSLQGNLDRGLGNGEFTEIFNLDWFNPDVGTTLGVQTDDSGNQFTTSINGQFDSPLCKVPGVRSLFEDYLLNIKTFRVKPPAQDGFFEFRGGASNKALWDKDSGAEL